MGDELGFAASLGVDADDEAYPMGQACMEQARVMAS